MLQEQVEEIKTNVEKQRKLSEAKALQKRATLDSLKADLEEKKKETEKNEKKLKEYETVNDELLKGIQVIYDLLRSDDAPLLQLLGMLWIFHILISIPIGRLLQFT